MYNKTSNVTFNVGSANWSMDVTVDVSIFDDPYVEACTRSIEIMIGNLKEGDDFLVNPIMTVQKVSKKKTKKKIINTYKVLLNAGTPSRAEMLRKVFYTSTSIDLAEEPLSSSKL